jgi:hypothetical protein
LFQSIVEAGFIIDQFDKHDKGGKVNNGVKNKPFVGSQAQNEHPFDVSEHFLSKFRELLNNLIFFNFIFRVCLPLPNFILSMSIW